MTSRRDLLALGAAGLGAWAVRPLPLFAAADPSRVALVVGNDRYVMAPLANASNDARGIATLLGNAGFTVDARYDADGATFAQAMKGFAERVARPEVKTAIFYYAGHGVQVDWRNYLLPVDARVASVAELKAQGVELGTLLTSLSRTKDKVFVLLLDACRDNPFGAGYAPEQKGLSQFDAPVGSLIGFSTAPGSVASDGQAGHGLYTENLVKELAIPGTRLEDALKRVRVNVRLASKGAQIPWESTSLETDVFLFPTGAAVVAEEPERQYERESQVLASIRGSRNPEDWARYVREFPRGKFSEIAQARLAQLVPAKRRSSEAAANPYSAGTFPIDRRFHVGDRAQYQNAEHSEAPAPARVLRREGERPAPAHRALQATPSAPVQVVTRVDEDNDRVEFNKGGMITDLLGNPIKLPNAEFDAPVQLTPAELQIGKRWSARYRQTMRGGRREADIDMDFVVVRREKVSVPAGEFNAFRIEGRVRTQGQLNGTMVIWEVPGLNFPVRRQRVMRRGERVIESEDLQLVAYRQAKA